MSYCSCITQSFKPCRNYALNGETRCARHIDVKEATWKRRYFRYFIWATVYEKGKLAFAKDMLLREGIQLTQKDIEKYTSSTSHQDLLFSLFTQTILPLDFVKPLLPSLLNQIYLYFTASGRTGPLSQVLSLSSFITKDPHLVIESLFNYMNNFFETSHTDEAIQDQLALYKQFLSEFVKLATVRKAVWYSYTPQPEWSVETQELFNYFRDLLRTARTQERQTLRQKTNVYKEELVMKVFHPSQLEKWFAQGYDLDDLDRFGW